MAHGLWQGSGAAEKRGADCGMDLGAAEKRGTRIVLRK